MIHGHPADTATSMRCLRASVQGKNNSQSWKPSSPVGRTEGGSMNNTLTDHLAQRDTVQLWQNGPQQMRL